MKILIVKTVPGKIDIKKITYNYQEIGLAKALTKKGHQCDVLCCANGKSNIYQIPVESDLSIKLYCIKSIALMKNSFFINADKILNQYDVLQLSEYNQLSTWHLAKKYKEKAIIYHGPYYSYFNKRYNLMSRFFDFIFLRRYIKLQTSFITKSALATDYLQSKGITKVKTIGVGIDLSFLNSQDLNEIDFAKKIKKSSSKHKVLYIGRIEPRRNPKFLLEILKELKNRKIDVQLILVGAGNPDYMNSFFAKAEELNVSNMILYEEQIQQKYLSQIYKIADILLLPTIYDIFGMVLLEAMYFQKVVITTVNGGSKTLIENGINGFVIQEFDPLQWVDCIEQILIDSKKRETISLSANKTISLNYTWDALADKFINAYSSKLSVYR